MTPLSGWENFYVIVGSSAGALIGLQFVVMTLMADMPMRDGAVQAGEAFGTPTTVHFGAVLLLAALATIPWDGMGRLAVLWGLLGFVGLLYSILVTRRMRTQTAYRPEFEDWLFHSLLPLAGYGILASSALAASLHPHDSLFGAAGTSLLLLFVGIHNSWDAVTYHVFVQRRKLAKESENAGKTS
ncbi:MAG TPA: hypothetical protein VMU28_15325 [Terriglobales bacterium]|nr:hypothetical protein [Terriglobales bacterium]